MKKQERTFIKTVEEVPVFFATDENYMPFLGVTLRSLIEGADARRKYAVHVLYTGKLGENAGKIRLMQTENVRLHFHDVTQEVEKIKPMIRCRDYYTSAIYFRLFIPKLFPQYDKAVYLDCDTVLLDDVAKLYDIPLGDNYVGAVSDSIVGITPSFVAYTKRALGIEAKKYFNSGVMVMQLDKLRAIDFCRLFTRVLGSYDFVVAPDQDCLNLLCQGKVHYLGKGWNVMPLATKKRVRPKLVHYNLSMKPWHYDGVLYEEFFWENAKKTDFYDTVLARKRAFTDEEKKKDGESGEKLLALAQAEADNPFNYVRTVGAELLEAQKRENGGGMYEFYEYFNGKKSRIKAD